MIGIARYSWPFSSGPPKGRWCPAAPGSASCAGAPRGAEGRGKRGGVRVIYYWATEEDVCYMLYAYAKNEQGDLTRGQIRALARLVREEFK